MELIKTIGVYILLFLPGYIFIETKDHFLLREKKAQFEKTLDIILFSFIIWLAIVFLPITPFFTTQKDFLIDQIVTSLKLRLAFSVVQEVVFKNIELVFLLIVETCCVSFIVACFYGFFRRFQLIDKVFFSVTKRDWFNSVAIKFLYRSLSKAVQVTTETTTYIGMLVSAPDRDGDEFIVISGVSQITEHSILPLDLTENLLIPLKEIKSIQLLKSTVLLDKRGERNAR